MSKKIKITLYTNIENNGKIEWNSSYTLPNPPYKGKFKEINVPTDEKLSFKSDSNNFDKLMKVLINPNVTVGGSSIPDDVHTGLKKMKAESEKNKLSKDLKKKKDKQIKENIYIILDIIFPKNGKFFIKDKILLVKNISWNEKINDNNIDIKLHLIKQIDKDKDVKLEEKITCDNRRSNVKIAYNDLIRETKKQVTGAFTQKKPSTKPYYFDRSLRISLDDKKTPTLYKGGKKTKKKKSKKRTKKKITNKVKK